MCINIPNWRHFCKDGDPDNDHHCNQNYIMLRRDDVNGRVFTHFLQVVYDIINVIRKCTPSPFVFLYYNSKLALLNIASSEHAACVAFAMEGGSLCLSLHVCVCVRV